MANEGQRILEFLHRQQLYLRAKIQHGRRHLDSKIRRNTYFVFVDGSFRSGVGIGYGAVIIKQGRVVQQIVGNCSEKDNAVQSLGEFTAVIKSIEWCEQRHSKKVIIHYDCEGIKHLANRYRPHVNKAKLQEAYRNYHMFMKPRMSTTGCQIELRKVKAHSCDFLNNWADRLAKMGLYRLTLAQVRKETLPRHTAKALLRMITKIEANPLEVQYV